jgi:hypothetical protein
LVLLNSIFFLGLRFNKYKGQAHAAGKRTNLLWGGEGMGELPIKIASLLGEER